MRKQLLKWAFVAVAAQALCTACQRRPLEDGLTQAALIPVRIDWSVSGVPVEQMHRASVILFPEGGGIPLEYRLETNLTYRLIEVPVGVYSVLVFNETKEPDDWGSLVMTGTDRYETFAAEGLPVAARGFYTRSEELPLIQNPEPLAAWSLDRFEVTREMAVHTNASRNLEEIVPELTVVRPLPRIEHLVVTAQVVNLSSSMQATGTLEGMASGVYLVSGRKVPVPAAHAFVLNSRVYADNGKDGTTSRTFSVFGRLPVSTARYGLNLDFLLNDGTLHPREAFDVTNRITAVPGRVVPTHAIDVGFGMSGGDRLIDLGSMDVASGGVTVDDWEEVIIPLK